MRNSLKLSASGVAGAVKSDVLEPEQVVSVLNTPRNGYGDAVGTWGLIVSFCAPILALGDSPSVAHRMLLEVMMALSCQILNQTAPLGFQVETLWPEGTLARYAMDGPGWKMEGLEETAAQRNVRKTSVKI